MRKNTVQGKRAALVLAVVLAGSGCVHDALTASRSSTILIIDRIEAAPGGSGAEPTDTFLQSDVVTGGSRFDDIARVTTRLALKDPGSAENPTSPTSANFVTIDRYRVEYFRADGRNDPGVDVPFPFEGAVTFTAVSGTQTADFVLVRASAKLEAPLAALSAQGGAIIINAIAEITFFGRDQTGTEITAHGSISINFADWADPDSAEAT